MRLYYGLLTCVFLAGCTTPPSVKYITVDKYVPLPPKLLEPCPIEQPKNNTVGEVVRVARQRKISLKVCNKHIKIIKKGQPNAREQ